MACSMTSYAYDERTIQGNVLSCEIKTVNHRYFDLSLRTVKLLKPFEAGIRRAINAKLVRGRVECVLEVKQQGESLFAQFDDEMLATFAREMNRVGEALRRLRLEWAPPSLLDVVKWQGAVGAEESMDPHQIHEHAMELLDQTLNGLLESRREEGMRLEGFILTRGDEFAKLVSKLRRRYPQALAATREKLMQKLASVDTKVDPQRMAQETMLLVQKFCVGADIAEELDRCDSHIEELRAIFKRAEPIGRRLDFLMQEMNRETNTIGSKSVDVETAHIAIEAKMLVEQMREQVQNLE